MGLPQQPEGNVSAGNSISGMASALLTYSKLQSRRRGGGDRGFLTYSKLQSMKGWAGERGGALNK